MSDSSCSVWGPTFHTSQAKKYMAGREDGYRRFYEVQEIEL